ACRGAHRARRTASPAWSDRGQPAAGSAERAPARGARLRTAARRASSSIASWICASLGGQWGKIAEEEGAQRLRDRFINQPFAKLLMHDLARESRQDLQVFRGLIRLADSQQ